MSKKRIQHSNVFTRNKLCTKRIRANEGGTGSSKTFSILQLLLFWHCFSKTGQIITIARETLSECKATVMRDFFNILIASGMYDERRHNKSEFTYVINGNVVEFIGMDKSHKKRGASRNILYINEITGLKFEDWFQLMIRTSDEIYLDYNPDIGEDHWIFNKLYIEEETGKPNEDVQLIHSTYMDNPFLPANRRKEIERLDKVDKDLADVYKYGKRKNIKGVIYHNSRNQFLSPDEYPSDFSVHGYGLDFGFTNDVTTLVECGLSDGILHSRELCYDTNMENNDIIAMFERCGINKRDEIFADSSNPKTIAELRSFGYNVIAVQKGPDSVLDGINIVKSYPIYSYGKNISSERRKYKWKKDKATDKFINIPVDAFNHCMDAERYFAMMRLAHRNTPRKRAKPRSL